MNLYRNRNRAGRWSSPVLVLLLGSLVGGYGLQSFALAQNSDQAEAKQAEPKAKMDMMCPMMAGLKGVELYADSPALLKARAEELGLEQEQKERLEEIAESARQQARDVLNAKQRQQLQQAPEGPLSMMQVAKMRAEAAGENDSKEMCPMCMQMMKKMKMQREE